MPKFTPPHNSKSSKKARKPAANGAARKAESFKLTYATMFNPPESMHTKYDKALAGVKAGMGRDYGMLINNRDVFAEEKFDDRSPIDTNWVLGTFQKGNAGHAHKALAAAAAAAPKWAGLKWPDRVRLLRRAAQQIEKRVYEIGAVLSLEV